jgi:hypothetical protein
VSAYRRATVAEVRPWGAGISEAELEFDDGPAGKAIVLESLVGPVGVGDAVVANTTAVDLELGSGGYHFVLWNLSRGVLDTGGAGHIMKLRYTPLQFNVEAAEESLADLEGKDLSSVLGGMPVIAGSLHSQLLPAALAYREASPGGRLAYVMTDGASLPAAFSHTVRFLKENGYIASVITSGNAFGGDLEAVTAHGALIAARRLVSADAAITVMGPGIVGTGSAVGFTGIEQGIMVNAASSLGGLPIAIPRITFADPRDRHRGLSHHTVSALTYGACTRAIIAMPAMEGERRRVVSRQIEESGLERLHEVREVDAGVISRLLEGCEFKPTVMGRGFDEEPEFFMAAAAAALIAAGQGGG